MFPSVISPCFTQRYRSSGFYLDAYGNHSGTCSPAQCDPALQLLPPTKLLLLPLPSWSLLLPWALQGTLRIK